MKYDLWKGRRGKEDIGLLIHTDGWEQISHKDLFTIVKFLYDNEDRLYPPPRGKGSRYLLEALTYLRTHSVKETLAKFSGKTRLP